MKTFYFSLKKQDIFNSFLKMKNKTPLGYTWTCYYKIFIWFLFVTSFIKIQNVDSLFYTGRTDHSINEMNRLNGRMTAREAVIKCELDDECAGFTYHGPKTLWDGHVFQVTFYL